MFTNNVHHGRRAVFCDRDGVINEDRGYVHSWENFYFFPGVPRALASLRRSGWILVLVTNQSGIGRGYYDESAFHMLTNKMQSALSSEGAQFDAIYFCPHAPLSAENSNAQACECRKPKPGMFFKAKQDLKLNMEASVCVGDKVSDLQAAKAAGVGLLYGVGEHIGFSECVRFSSFDNPESALCSICETFSGKANISTG